ncbi:MAG: restriction endonuclease subunit S [Flavobacteriales bacterium]|nr:restriction endonuclease subunit S [Flavobacteriales bacterium]
MREDWVEVEIKDVGTVIAGGTPKTAIPEYWGDDFSWISPSDLTGYTNTYISKGKKSISKLGLAKSSARLIPKGSVLFSCRAPIGYVAIAHNELTTNQGFKSLAPREVVISEFVYHYFKSIKWLAEKNAGGTTFKEISTSSFSALPFPLPPLPEQRAIVSKIEQLFSELDNGIANLKTAQHQLKVYRQAVLKQAFEGELTKEWRAKQNDLPTADELLKQIKEEREAHYQKQLVDWKEAVKDWEKNSEKGKKPSKPKQLKKPSSDDLPDQPFDLPTSWLWSDLYELTSKVSDGPFGSHLKGEDYIDAGIRVVRLENIKSLMFDDSKRSFVNQAKYESISQHTVYPGEIIFSTFIADETKVVILPEVFDFAINKADCVQIKPWSLVSNRFLQYYLASSISYSLLVNQVHGATRPRVNTTQLKLLFVPMCSTIEQHQIVQEIESRLSVCDKLEESITQSLLKAEALRQSILKKAFEGRLLTEVELAACKKEKDWEPAGVLLGRVKQEKAKKK